MKKKQRILVIILAVVVGVALVKNQLIKLTITTVGASVVGAPIKVRHFSISFLTQRVHIKGFQLYNPKGFPKEPMVDIEEIAVNYNLFALLQGKLHLPLIVFDMKEMVIIKDKDGNLNVDSLKVAQAADKADKKETPKEQKKKEKPQELAMQIDLMKLNIGQVVYKDYTKGETPVVNVYDVGIKDKEYRNITSAQQMAANIMVAGLGPTAIKSAKIYAAATILGVGFLPVGVAGLLISDDDSQASFNKSVNQVFAAAVKLFQEIGQLKSEDKSSGVIKASVDGTDITMQIGRADNKTKVVVAARKMMIPKPQAAAGIIRQLSEKLK